MPSKLQFTGNWFIDAGILGFVNLMEEVYGDIWKEEWKKNNSNKSEWKFDFLDYLNGKIEENEELIYYGYFPFGYFINNLKLNLNNFDIRNFKIAIEKENNKNAIFEKSWFFINKYCKKTWVDKKISDLDALSKKFKELRPLIDEIKNLLKELNNKKDEQKKIIPKKKKLGISTLLQFETLLNEIKSKPKQGIPEEFFSILKKIEEKKKSLSIRLSELWNKKDENSSFFRIPISERFFINFLIFQTGDNYTYLKQKKDLFNIISFNLERRCLRKFDRTMNKFLISEEKMSNVFYTSPLNMENLKKEFPYFCVYILCFPLAFINFNQAYYFFYSPEIKFCYSVNKRLKTYFNMKKGNILKVTYQAVMDTLVEYKSVWALENMYIVTHRGISRETQEIQNVEYLGVPKLQVQVLLDDHIRNALNVYLQIREKNFKGPKNVWLLEEFVKGKPLYEASLRHIKIRLSKDINKLKYAIFYALLLNATISEFKKKTKKILFSRDFLSKNYRELVYTTKAEFSAAFYYSTQDIPKYIGNRDEKERTAYLLLDAICGNNKTRFLTILLKQLNNIKNISQSTLNWIFDKVINNDISWKEYALLLTGGLVYKNE